MYNALTIAKYVIDYSHEKGKSISNLRLQKILYFLQAQFLDSTGEACFKDRIEAWDTGPVVPSVYYHYSVFGSTSIPQNRNETMYFIFHREEILSEHKVIINRLLDALEQYSTTALVKLSQSQDPWKVAYSRSHLDNEITREYLKAYFNN